ncbi:MAG: GAF domain-containing protein [Anaerolineae bacterium]|nr:GAF domain-containing protein [Anaerolineae bacterium]
MSAGNTGDSTLDLFSERAASAPAETGGADAAAGLVEAPSQGDVGAEEDRAVEPDGGEGRPGEEGIERERERILRLLLGGATASGSIAVAVMLLGSVQDPSRFPAFLPFIVAYLVVVLAYVLRRAPFGWRVGVLIGVSYGVSLFSVLQNGLTGTGPWYLLAIPTLFYVLIGARAGLAASIANALVFLLLTLAFHLGWLRELDTIEIGESLSQALVVAASFVLISAVVTVAHSLFARSQRRARSALQEQGSALALAHAEGERRQQELERANAALLTQARHFGLSIEVGRIAAMGLGVEELAQQAVSLVCARTGVDVVGLFLLDEERLYADLQAAAGLAPEELAGAQRRLHISDDLLLRQCVSSGREQVVLGIDHVTSLTGGGESPLLRSDTRAALALPLVSQGVVFGVLTLQIRSALAFGRDDVVSLRTVADQVATALTSARLAQELRAQVHEMETLQRYYVREAWEEFLTTYGAEAFTDVSSLVDDSGDTLPRDGGVVFGPAPSPRVAGPVSATGALVAPIALRDQVLGVLEFQHSDADEGWSEDQLALIEAVSEQMSMILENSRLFAEARLRAARERRVGEISARMRESLDVERVLQTAVGEIGKALDLHDITIQLRPTARQTPEGNLTP